MSIVFYIFLNAKRKGRVHPAFHFPIRQAFAKKCQSSSAFSAFGIRDSLIPHPLQPGGGVFGGVGHILLYPRLLIRLQAVRFYGQTPVSRICGSCSSSSFWILARTSAKYPGSNRSASKSVGSRYNGSPSPRMFLSHIHQQPFFCHAAKSSTCSRTFARQPGQAKTSSNSASSQEELTTCGFPSTIFRNTTP